MSVIGEGGISLRNPQSARCEKSWSKRRLASPISEAGTSL
jgi:hypothetical protein